MNLEVSQTLVHLRILGKTEQNSRRLDSVFVLLIQTLCANNTTHYVLQYSALTHYHREGKTIT